MKLSNSACEAHSAGACTHGEDDLAKAIAPLLYLLSLKLVRMHAVMVPMSLTALAGADSHCCSRMDAHCYIHQVLWKFAVEGSHQGKAGTCPLRTATTRIIGTC